MPICIGAVEFSKFIMALNRCKLCSKALCDLTL